jgi:hypothetical protein
VNANRKTSFQASRRLQVKTGEARQSEAERQLGGDALIAQQFCEEGIAFVGCGLDDNPGILEIERNKGVELVGRNESRAGACLLYKSQSPRDIRRSRMQ